jgi:hypothetical protein
MDWTVPKRAAGRQGKSKNLMAAQPVLTNYYRLDAPPGAAAFADLSPAHAIAAFSYSGIGSPPLAVEGVAGISSNSALFSGLASAPLIIIPSSPALSPVNSDGQTGAPFSVELWV